MKFRKKPVVIEAEQFREGILPLPFREKGVCCLSPDGRWFVETLEGPLRISEGDWIIRGVNGEYYPCKPEIFEATYERLYLPEELCQRCGQPAYTDGVFTHSGHSFVAGKGKP